MGKLKRNDTIDSTHHLLCNGNCKLGAIIPTTFINAGVYIATYEGDGVYRVMGEDNELDLYEWEVLRHFKFLD